MEENKKSTYQLACEALEIWRQEFEKAIEEKMKDVAIERFNHLKSIYQTAYRDIVAGINLDKWNEDIDIAIEEVKLEIKNHNGATPFLDTIKNDLFYLKYLISEKT